MTLHDFLPDEKLREVENLHDFAGMLVFDKWTCNTNGRQTVFFENFSRRSPEAEGAEIAGRGEVVRGTVSRDTAPGHEGSSVVGTPNATATEGNVPGQVYRTVMIDQGFCFNAGEWNFPDAPLRGLYARNRVYEGVTGMHSFSPWLERMEKRITEKVLAELAEEIPPAWYDDDYDAVLRMLEQLYRRRKRVEELLWSAKNSNRAPFPSWRD
jgi:hypothetical protein